MKEANDGRTEGRKDRRREGEAGGPARKKAAAAADPLPPPTHRSPFPTEVERRRNSGVLNGNSYLVDPASSHMLVSKIKPCMCKYRLYNGETANGSLDQLWFLRSYNPTWITVAILELIHADNVRPSQEDCFY